jgi:hypothetical protein
MGSGIRISHEHSHAFSIDRASPPVNSVKLDAELAALGE